MGFFMRYLKKQFRLSSCWVIALWYLYIEGSWRCRGVACIESWLNMGQEQSGSCRNPLMFGSSGLAFVSLWLFCLLWLLPGAALADDGFVVQEVLPLIKDGVYYLDTRIKYGLSDTALEALQNGVPLTIAVEFEVLKLRKWLWAETAYFLVKRLQLRYHALANLYQLVDLDDDGQTNFSTLNGALGVLGDIRDVATFDQKLLMTGASYKARVRVRLDVEALPLPLRPVAYVSSEWRLDSEWYYWQLLH